MPEAPKSPNNNDSREPPKGTSINLFAYLLVILLIVILLTNFLGPKQSQNVRFGRQIEHLVNLDLIDPTLNSSAAVSDQLVTISGRFRESLTSATQPRLDFLGGLDAQLKLSQDLKGIVDSIPKLQDEARNRAILFLAISGISIPEDGIGYRVIDNTFDYVENKQTVDRHIFITAKDIPPTFHSVPSLRKDLATLTATSAAFDDNISQLVQRFASNEGGLGVSPAHPCQKQLTEAKDLVAKLPATFAERKAAYVKILDILAGVATALDVEQGDVRLLSLSSVKDYVDAIQQKAQTETASKKQMEVLAELANKAAATGIVEWFVGDKRYMWGTEKNNLLSLDYSDYHLWYSKAKTECDNFAANAGKDFTVPNETISAVVRNSFQNAPTPANWSFYISLILPLLVIGFGMWYLFGRQMKGMGGSALTFGKSPAKMWADGQGRVTFKDVAGIEEAKEELVEIVEFLKNPTKFSTLGGEIPKGVLLVGPPGTGKTLIARAVAGEAKRPFFSISGSDFVEMFVGVGASRIRDLFEQAKKNAPCIIFIDEIDAVGRHRGSGMGGGHDEREQTLNQLLVEMDGFDPNEGVILIAATNRPDVLDKALLRPGRFDRSVMIMLPDVKGRYEILKVHARKVKLDASVDLMQIARQTPGSSGAELKNLLNEAALLAARKGRSAVTLSDTLEASDKVRFGKERKSLELNDQERRSTAYHEAGHAIIGLVSKHTDPVEKVTIIPRGFSLGATYFLPKKEVHNYWRSEMHDRLAMMLGGRAAEEVFLNDCSSGAKQDIEQASNLARAMVCQWGMDTELGMVAYHERNGSAFLQSGVQAAPYSDETARLIDEAVKKLINDGHAAAIRIMNENRAKVELMTDMLMEFETLDKEDLDLIMKGEWNTDAKRARLAAIQTAHVETTEQTQEKKE